MNFLGHQYLAQHDTDLMVGNFIADAVKGKAFKLYPEGIAKGILMHREIDSFTDTHAATREGRKRLQTRYKKYAAVLTDVFYDHFLAVNWSQYHAQTLSLFSSEVYRLMQANFDLLPPKSQYMLPYMIKYNWLLNYSKIEGIKRTLGGMSQRTKFESGIEHAGEELELYYAEFHKDFSYFFNDAILYFEKWK